MSIQKLVQKITFTGNLDQVGNTTVFFVPKYLKETILDFSQRTLRVLLMRFIILFCFCVDIISI